MSRIDVRNIGFEIGLEKIHNNWLSQKIRLTGFYFENL